MIVNLVINKFENKYRSYPQLTRIHNQLRMSIVNTPENYLSNIERKHYISKVHTHLVNS